MSCCNDSNVVTSQFVEDSSVSKCETSIHRDSIHHWSTQNATEPHCEAEMDKTRWIAMLIHCREITIVTESYQREQCATVLLQQSECDLMVKDRYKYFPVTSNCGIVGETLRTNLVVAGTMSWLHGIPYLKFFFFVSINTRCHKNRSITSIFLWKKSWKVKGSYKDK